VGIGDITKKNIGAEVIGEANIPKAEMDVPLNDCALPVPSG
jgi:hypothetical protein